MIEKELVWEELGLDSLLSYEQSIERQLDQKLFKSKPESLKKHAKMLKKPGYAVVIERYKAAPTKPKTISKSKLSELADPVLGKLTHHERQKLEKYNGHILPHRSHISNSSPEKSVAVSHHYESGDDTADARANQFLGNYGSIANHPSPFHQYNDIRKFPSKPMVPEQIQDDSFLSPIIEENTPRSNMSHQIQNHHSNNNGGNGLFLTEMEENGNFIEANIKNNKNSFSSILRNRIQQAQKLNKLLQPIDLQEINHQSPVKGRFEEQAMSQVNNLHYNQPAASYQQKSSAYPNSNGIQRKAELKKKIIVTAQSKNPKGIKFGGQQLPQQQPQKKIRSSGYSTEVKRYSNQPKPLPKKPNNNKSSQQGIFLTADNQSTEDEQSMKERARNRLKNRLSYNPTKQPPKRAPSKERISSTQVSGKERLNNKKNDQNMKNNRSSRSSLLNSKKNQEGEENMKGRAKSLTSFNKNKNQDNLANNRNSSNTRQSNKQPLPEASVRRNYSIRRSSSSVPDLLRQKVQQNRVEVKSSLEPAVIMQSEASINQIGELQHQPSSDNIDLSTIINKLQSIEESKGIGSKFQQPKNKPSDEAIQDKQMTSLLKKHAEKLNQYLNDAQGYLEEYQQLRDY